jgi:hypothetical protein
VFVPQVLDAWLVKDVAPRLQGRCCVTRCADDCIIGCELAADACRVRAVLPKRFHRFKLTLHPDKTAFIAFKQPPRQAPSARGTGSFAFLGFIHYGAQTRRGSWGIKRTTVGKRPRRLMRALWTWRRDNRHAPGHEQYQSLGLKRRGSSPYYGIRGNFKRREVGGEPTARAWRSWLSRRRPKGHRRWQKFVASLQKDLALPNPRIVPNL